jgi:tetratricopeptide (TPR) repeat protein
MKKASGRTLGTAASRACAVRTIYVESRGRKRGSLSRRRLSFPLSVGGAVVLILEVVSPPRYMLAGGWGWGQEDSTRSAPAAGGTTPRGTLNSLDHSSDSAARYEALLQKAAQQTKAGKADEALKTLDSLSSEPKLPQAYFELRGNIEAQTKQFQLAESDLKRAVSMTPNSVSGLYALGLVELQLGRAEEARTVLLKAAELNSGSPETWLALGDAQLRLKYAAQAERAFQTALRVGNGSAHIYFAIGMAYENRGDYGKAVLNYRQAASVSSPNPAVLIAWLRALLEDNRKDEALRLVSRWRIEGRSDPALNTELGILLAEAHLYSEASREFEAGLRSDPDSYDLKYNLALAYLSEGRYGDAGKIANELLKERDTEDVHDLLGLVYEQTSQPSAAAREFEKALGMDHHQERYYLQLGSLYLQGGEYVAAEGRFLMGAKLCPAPGCFRSLVGLGVALRMEAKYDSAVEVLERAIREEPGNYGGYMYLGDTLIRWGRWKEAAAPLKQAIGLDPSSSLLHYMYAYAVLKGFPDNVSEADSHLREAVRLDPENALAYYRLGITCNTAKDYGRALTYLRKAVSLKPDLKEAHYQLALAYQKLGNKSLAEQEFHFVSTHSTNASDEEQEEIIRVFGRISSK